MNINIFLMLCHYSLAIWLRIELSTTEELTVDSVFCAVAIWANIILGLMHGMWSDYRKEARGYNNEL